MNSKNEYKDNVIIALSVALVVAVLCCAVMGVVLGIGGDISATTEVAEAYYSPSANYVDFRYFYIYTEQDFVFQYGDIHEYSYSLSDFQSLLPYDEFNDVVDAECGIPIRWWVALVIDDYVQTSPQSWFEFSVGTYSEFDYETIRYQNLVANYDNGFTVFFECWGTDLYFDIEFRDSSVGNEWCDFNLDEIEVTYIVDERSWLYGYEVGFDKGFDGGFYAGSQETYQPAYDEGFDRGYDEGYDGGHYAGYNEGYGIGKGVGFSEGVASASDYTFFSLITSVFDAPLRVLVGQWVDTDNDGVVDELVGGFLNFYIPVLDINLAPLILSIFTLCIIIVVIRFVLARL